MQAASTDDLIFSRAGARRPPVRADDARARRHRLDRNAGGRRQHPQAPRLAEARRRDRDQLADPGAAGDDDRLSPSPRWRDEQGRQHQRQEPDHVEVEPVRRPELDGDQHRRRQRGDLGGGLSRRPERHREGEGDRARPLDRPQEVKRGRLAPDAERRAARGLVAERAIVELSQAAVGEEGQDQQRADREEGDPEDDRGAPPALAGAGREQRRQRRGAELCGWD